MLMSVAACLLAGCGDPVAPLQAGQAVSPGVVQASVAETPHECREVTFTITGPETVVGQWPDSTCQEGIKVIAGAPMEWQEEGGRRLRMIVRYVNLTGVAVGLPLDVMLPVGSKFPLEPSTAAHSTMVPLEYDSLGINGRTWWSVAGPAGVLGVGDTSRVDTLLFQIKAPVVSAMFRFNHYPVEAAIGDTSRPAAPWPGVWPEGEPLLVVDPARSDLTFERTVFDVFFDDTTSGLGVQSFMTGFSARIIGRFTELSPDPNHYLIEIPDPGPEWSQVDSVASAMRAFPGVAWAQPSGFGSRMRLRSRFPIDSGVSEGMSKSSADSLSRHLVEVAIGDTSRPAAPWPGIYPEGEPLLVVDPARPGLTFQRTVIQVVFDDTTSGIGVRDFMTTFSARIIGRFTELFPDLNDYIIEIPDPGSEWSEVYSVITAMMAFPGVRLAGPSGFGSRMRIRSRFPIDSGVSVRLDKVGADSLSRHLVEVATGDTSRPAAPWPGVYPEGEPLLVVDPSRSWLKYRRTVFQVFFDDSTSGLGVRDFMTRFSARIIGRVTEQPDSVQYLIEIPDPGTEWTQVDSLGTAMRGFPGVRFAGPLGFGSRMRLRSRFPIDSGVSVRVDKVGADSLSRHSVEAAIGDTSRPAAPWPGVWPEGEPLLVVDPARPWLKFERSVFSVRFEDTTPGFAVRDFMARFSARIIGRLTELLADPNHYLIEIPDPGPEWSQVDSVASAMRAFPGVAWAQPSGFGSRMRLRSRFPLDSGVSETPSVWFLGDTGAVPMQAPNSKPPWFGDDSTWAQGGVRKWTVGLAFLPGATLAQRDAAVSRVRGQVVGGLASSLGGEGTYYIRLPWAVEADSLIAAVALLNQQPGVDFAALLLKPQTLARPSARFNRYPLEAITDTTRPVAPYPTVFPQDSLLLVASPSGVRYRRTVFHVVFSDTTSGITIRSFMTRFSATIIGRMGPAQGPSFPWFDYYFTIPDPGQSWQTVDSLMTAMNTFQGVEAAGSIAFDNVVRFR